MSIACFYRSRSSRVNWTEVSSCCRIVRTFAEMLLIASNIRLTWMYGELVNLFSILWRIVRSFCAKHAGNSNRETRSKNCNLVTESAKLNYYVNWDSSKNINQLQLILFTLFAVKERNLIPNTCSLGCLNSRSLLQEFTDRTVPFSDILNCDILCCSLDKYILFINVFWRGTGAWLTSPNV
jgi:hypothetical protein